MSAVRVAIVGGGIGGLTAGLALRSVVAEVDVYEQAPALGEVGAGVALAPGATCSVEVTAIPSRAGTMRATLTVAGTRGETASATLAITATSVTTTTRRTTTTTRPTTTTSALVAITEMTERSVAPRP